MRQIAGAIILVLLMVGMVAFLIHKQERDDKLLYRVEMMQNGIVVRAWTSRGLVRPVPRAWGEIHALTFTDDETGYPVTINGEVTITVRSLP